MRRKTQIAALFAIFLVALPQTSRAEVRLPTIFTDSMVLQHGQQLPVWGWAAPGERVDVAIATSRATTTAAKDGRWRVNLPKLPVSRSPLEMRVTGSSGDTVSVNNILVGEVWLCTGPSNIFWPVKRCDNAKREIATAKYPTIRFFTVEKNAADDPQPDCRGEWFSCSPQTVGDVSGIGYFFARRIHNELDMPVGVFQSFWGGSRVESWTSIEALKAQPALEPMLESWKTQFAEFEAGKPQAAYKQQLTNWRQATRPPPNRSPPRTRVGRGIAPLRSTTA